MRRERPTLINIRSNARKEKGSGPISAALGFGTPTIYGK